MQHLSYKTRVLETNSREDELYEIFHESTKFTPANAAIIGPRIAAYLRNQRWSARSAGNYKSYPTLPSIALTKPAPLETGIGETLKLRESVRHFEKRPLSIAQVSDLLFYSAGITRTAQLAQNTKLSLKLRSYPSGGALYPIELYALLLNVEGIEPSVVHFNPVESRLEIVAPLDPGLLRTAIWNDEDDVRERASLGIIMSGIPQRAVVKYGARGYRFMLLEVGFVAQNISLTACAMSLGTCAWSSFFDDRVDKMLGLDGVDEMTLHMIFVGHQASTSGADSR